jgi:hypothetical protein
MTVTTRWTLFLAVLAIAIPGRVYAADLFTSPLLLSTLQTAICSVSNVGTTPLDMTVELLDPNLSLFGPRTCTNTNPGGICSQAYANNSGSPQPISCKVTAKSKKKVRGIIANTSTGASSEAR